MVTADYIDWEQESSLKDFLLKVKKKKVDVCGHNEIISIIVDSLSGKELNRELRLFKETISGKVSMKKQRLKATVKNKFGAILGNNNEDADSNSEKTKSDMDRETDDIVSNTITIDIDNNRTNIVKASEDSETINSDLDYNPTNIITPSGDSASSNSCKKKFATVYVGGSQRTFYTSDETNMKIVRLLEKSLGKDAVKYHNGSKRILKYDQDLKEIKKQKTGKPIESLSIPVSDIDISTGFSSGTSNSQQLSHSGNMFDDLSVDKFKQSQIKPNLVDVSLTNNHNKTSSNRFDKLDKKLFSSQKKTVSQYHDHLMVKVTRVLTIPDMMNMSQADRYVGLSFQVLTNGKRPLYWLKLDRIPDMLQELDDSVAPAFFKNVVCKQI